MRYLLDTQVMLWWLLDDPRRIRVATVVGTLEVSPLIFRDQSIEEGADLLPVLDSAGERHHSSRG